MLEYPKREHAIRRAGARVGQPKRRRRPTLRLTPSLPKKCCSMSPKKIALLIIRTLIESRRLGKHAIAIEYMSNNN